MSARRFAPATLLLLTVGLMLLPASASAEPPNCYGLPNNPGSPAFQAQPGEAITAGYCLTQDSAPVQATITQQGAHGTATVVHNGTNQVDLLYTANAGTAGMTDTFKFRGTSNGGEPDSEVTQSVNIVANHADPPVCQHNGQQQYTPGVPRTAGSCSDPDAGDVLHVVIPQQGARGTAAVVNNNTDHPSVRYTAQDNPYGGGDSFTFHATDSTNLQSSWVTVSTFNNAGTRINAAPTCDLFDSLGKGWEMVIGGSVSTGQCQDDFGNVHLEITKQGTKGVASVSLNDRQFVAVVYATRDLGRDQFKVVAIDEQGLRSPEYTVNTLTIRTGPGGGIRYFSGSSKAGTVRVGKKGSFTLKAKVNCTGTGPNCKVANALSAKVAAGSAKTMKLGSSKFTVKTGKKGAIKLKLTKKGLKLLKRKRQDQGQDQDHGQARQDRQDQDVQRDAEGTEVGLEAGGSLARGVTQVGSRLAWGSHPLRLHRSTSTSGRPSPT